MSQLEKLKLNHTDQARKREFVQQKENGFFNCRIVTGNGKLTAEEGIKICELAKQYGDGEIAFATRQTVEIMGISRENLDLVKKEITEMGLIMGEIGPKIKPIVACKGSNCQYGLIDTFALAEKLHQLFFVRYHDVELPNKFKITVSGCANKCVKPELNDIGIVGQLIPQIRSEKCVNCKECVIERKCEMHAVYKAGGKIHIDTKACTHCGQCMNQCEYGVISSGISGYKLYIGGRWGKEIKAGYPLSKIILGEEQLLSVIERAIALYKESGNQGERFADVIQRIGNAEVEKILLGE